MQRCPSENELLGFALHGAGALEPHLTRCERCRTAVAELHSQTCAPVARGASLARGAEVGRYVVLEQVGEGAMGQVYAAWDPVLDRKVALKLIHVLLDGPEAQERLLLEARSLARVTHPNLVAVHDAGAFERSVFIAMEFVDGVTLRTWLGSAARSRADVVGAFLQAGQGLVAAHDAGLVHRDFKPENVLVGRDGRVRVSDFGLARLETLATGADRGAQVTGLAGTPAYMAPEQLSALAADARSDQFAFCVSLYEALTGQRPFANNTAELVAKGPPVEGLPSGAVQRVVLRGLSVEPTRRFPDLHALLAALQPGSTRRPLAVAALLSVLALGAGFGVGTRRSAAALCATGSERVAAVLTATRRDELTRHFASLGDSATLGHTLEALDAWSGKWAALHREVCEATRVRGEQSDQLLSARMACLDRRLLELEGVLGVLATTDAESLPRAPDAVAALTPLAVCNNTTALLDARRPEDPRVAERVAQIERALSRAASLKEAGRFKEGLPLATTAVLEAHQLHWAPLEAEALLVRGQLTDGAGELAAAEPMLRDAWTRALKARDDRRAVLAAVNLSFVLSELNRMKDADEWVWQAAAVFARSGSDFDLEARVANQEGHLLFARSDFAGAEVRYRHAWEVRRDNQGQHHPMTLGMLGNVASALAGQGHYDAALPMLKDVARGFEVAYGPGHFKVGVAHNGVASQLLNLGRNAEALAVLDAVLPAQEAALGRDNQAVARLLLNRASALDRLQRSEEALALFEQALAVFEKADMPLMVGEVNISLGTTKAGLKRLDEALAHFRKAREVLAAVFGEHEEIIVSWECEGEALLAHGRVKEALAVFTRSLAMREQAGGADDPFCALSLGGLGRAQKAAGLRAAAKVTLQRAVSSLEASGVSDEELAASREALAEL